MNISKFSILLGCVLIFCSSCAEKKAAEEKAFFQNPIAAHGADPWIIKHDSIYYYCASTEDRTISVGKSALLHVPGELKKVWQAPDTGWNSDCVWAPELHYWNGHWYIYYAAGESGPPFIHQRTGVLESVTDDPQGEYVEKGGIVTGTGHNSVTWSKDRKQMYCVYYGRTQKTGEERVVFIDKMHFTPDGLLVVDGPTTEVQNR